MITNIEQMKDLNVKTLKWLQPNGWVDTFELRDGDKLIAIMKIPRMWSNRAIVEAGDKKWILQRPGVFSWCINIQDSNTNSIIGCVKKYVWRSDELEIFGQGKYKIKWFNFWAQKWGIVDNVNRKVVLFSSYGKGFKDFFKHQAIVEIGSDFQELPTLIVMICAAWYFHILEQKAAAAAAAAS